jgi:GNAT superfamily N-acetyltransferase
MMSHDDSDRVAPCAGTEPGPFLQGKGRDFQLRPAQQSDVPDLLRLIKELADYERLAHMVQATEALLLAHLFGPQPAAQAWVAVAPKAPRTGESSPHVVGFALFFTNFSTFMAKPGLYLEDLYVQPEFRGWGIGQALIRQLAHLACEQGCGRFEWAVLDWNQSAIDFYQRMGATVMPDWRICRVSGPALQTLGSA